MKYFQKILSSIIKAFKDDKFLLPVFILSVVFIILSSILPAFQVKQDFLKFFSPDENANYVFTKLYQETDQLTFFEKYNLIAQDIIRPRSYFSYQGIIKPVSFLGMTLLYGNLAKVFGSGIIPFLTPLFAGIGLIFYYLLIKLLFGSKNAFISFLLFFSFPVLIYYSARSMFHNVLFLSFFIIALYFLTKLIQKKIPSIKTNQIDKKKYYQELFSRDFVFALLTGLFLGLTIAVRTSELVWLIPAGLLFFLFNIKKFNWWRLAIIFSFLFLALLPVFYNNQLLYGSPFYGGYNEMNRSIENIGQASGSLFKSFFSGHLSEVGDLIKSIFNTIFYFGFYPLQSFFMFFKYCTEMFWYLFYPFVFGLVYLIIYDRSTFKKVWTYGLSWLVLSLILILYYGSWKFVDNPDPNSFTIGNSYTRYWLPIYISLFPFVSIFILKIKNIFFWIKKIRIKKIVSNAFSVSLIILIMFLSLRFVYAGSEEGLKHYFSKSRIAKIEVEQVISLTEDRSIIITEYHDKFLFPERKVIVGRFDDDNMNKNYYRLASKIPLYYYNFTLPEKDIKYLNERRLKDFNLRIELVKSINDAFSLYQLKALSYCPIN
ncbi:MAG TPA: glycosyltransferase family 39 protein [bacterium]|nr:glycosyltransferase family 39 protein [bacterium]